MDKKLKYTQQSSAKGNASVDAKKNQDVVGSGKIFPKAWRRKESTTLAGGHSKNNEQQARKMATQKGKTFDKRPKPKGQHHGGAKENTKVEDTAVAEAGSLMVPGSKKQNLNHLLNFDLSLHNVSSGSSRYKYGRTHNNNYNGNNRWLPPIHRHKYNKEQFILANCQFVVKADNDYTAYLADPDVLIDWTLVEQIRIHSSENLSCPICLGRPVAGKMTRCGHVYCWPCILHYLALSEEGGRNRCPICYEAIHKADLKSVVVITENPLTIGDYVTFRLMRRERGSLIAMPVEEDFNTETVIPTNFISLADYNKARQIYSKLLLASKSDVGDIIECEKVALEFELMEDPRSPENCFIQQALSELAIRGQPEEAEPKPKNEKIKSQDRQHQRSIDEESNALQGESIDGTPDIRSLSKFFYFYQAQDGQHVYLDAMNIKMLESQYTRLEDCPRLIWGRLIDKEVGSFTEELRRRMRYLHHLPLTCQFEIAEIELAPPFVSEEVISIFAVQIENREKKRRRRERDEKQREKKIALEQNRQMGKIQAPMFRFQIESHKHFPECQPISSLSEYPNVNGNDNAEALPTSWIVAGSSSLFNVHDSSTSTSSSDHRDDSAEQGGGPSFAQMLRNSERIGSGKNRPRRSPSVSSTILDSEEASYCTPSSNTSLGDALAQAFDNTNLLEISKTTPSGNKKKKKNKKGTVLFATGMSRTS